MRPPAVRRERVRFRPSGMARSGRRSAAHEKLSSGGPAAESGKGADARLGMTLRRRKAFAGRQEILMRKAVPGTAGRCRCGASFEPEQMLCGSRNAEKLPQCGRSPKREKLLWQRGAACKNEPCGGFGSCGGEEKAFPGMGRRPAWRAPLPCSRLCKGGAVFADAAETGRNRRHRLACPGFVWYTKCGYHFPDRWS